MFDWFSKWPLDKHPRYIHYLSKELGDITSNVDNDDFINRTKEMMSKQDSILSEISDFKQSLVKKQTTLEDEIEKLLSTTKGMLKTIKNKK